MGLARHSGRSRGRAIGFGSDDGASREIDAHANDIGRINATLLQDGGDGAFEDLKVIVGVLKGPNRVQALPGLGQSLIDNAVGIGMHGHRDNAAIRHIHQDGAPDSVP